MSEAALAPGFLTFPDTAALAEAAAAAIAAALAAGLAREGRAAMVATGGSSPIGAYQRLSRLPIDWARVEITLSDERWTPPTGADSNERMVRQHLLADAASAARFEALWSSAPTPEAAAERADPLIGAMAPFDIVLLGMGEDGHFASLFPGNPMLALGLDEDSPRSCIAVPAAAPAPPQPRISLTLRALLQARSIVLLISGDAKHRTVEAALAGADLPVRRLLTQDHAPVSILWSP